MKAILYVRVSSKEQEKEGFSLDAQEKLGIDYAAKRGLEIVKRWKVSESAWKEERESFNEMINYAQKHDEIIAIIFDVTDRMTRNDLDKYKIYRLIKEFSKEIHFSRTGKIFDKDSGSDEEFMLDIEVAFAKKWSNAISEKTIIGMREKALQGTYPGNAPLGYKNNHLDKIIEQDPTTAPIVEKAFKLYATGNYSLKMIEDFFYSQGFISRKGIKLGKCTIYKLLRSPFYYGYFTWGKVSYKGNHPPLISKNLFDQVQVVLDGKTHTRINKYNFAFNNLVLCGSCGCKVLGELKKGKYIYYHCGFYKGQCKNGDYIPENVIINKFDEIVKQVSIPDNHLNWIIKTLKDYNKNNKELINSQDETARAEHTKLKERLNKLYDDKLDGIITEGFWKEKSQEYERRIASLATVIKQNGSSTYPYYENAIRILELSNHLKYLYVRENPQGKGKILKTIASNYTLNNATLCPTYRKPFSMIAKGLQCLQWGRKSYLLRTLSIIIPFA